MAYFVIDTSSASPSYYGNIVSRHRTRGAAARAAEARQARLNAANPDALWIYYVAVGAIPRGETRAKKGSVLLSDLEA